MLGLIATVQALVLAAAVAHGVDPQRMLGVARCESHFNPFVVNQLGARGVYQLMPGGELNTFYARGYSDWADPSQQANFAAEEFALGKGPRAWAATWGCYGG